MVKRFINADGYASTGQGFLGYNMFAYCNNSPSNKIDMNGEYTFPSWVYKYFGTEWKYYEYLICMSKKYTNRPNSGLVGVPDEEIQRKARDRSLPGDVRKVYQEEEKVRGLRNKQKRNSNFTVRKIAGATIVTASILALTIIVADDYLGVGTIDDPLIIPILGWINKGSELLLT